MISSEYMLAKSATDITLDLKTLKYAYQPIFDIRTGAIFGYEALMRPADHTPLEIIDAYTKANQLDFIEEISLYYGTKFFKEAGLEGYLFINSFADACMSSEGAKKVADLGGQEMASRLVFEILEYGKIDPSVWRVKKHAIEVYGSHPLYAIDDYGTGGNNDYRCIDFFQPDIVKIDRSYIQNIDSNPANQDVIADMLEYMHNRGVLVLAEGVETKAEYEYLCRKDIDLAQGYYLGKPKIYS